MATADTKSRITSTLRKTDAPALSAKQIADELDVVVKTIHNNIGEVVENGSVKTTRIGNATAYYVPFEDRAGHRQPDHTCRRCGREVDSGRDIAKVEVHRYYEHENHSDAMAPFHVLCRFCEVDLVSFLFGDPGSIGSYTDVHSWEIPKEQLEEVRQDPDTPSAPNPDVLDGEQLTVYNVVKELEESDVQTGGEGTIAGIGMGDSADPKNRVSMEVIEEAVDLDEYRLKQTLNDLHSRGFLRKDLQGYQVAR